MIGSSHKFIDSAQTQNNFGYKPDSLSFGSRKPIIVICEFCGITFQTSFKYLNAHKSRTAHEKSIICVVCKGLVSAYIKCGSGLTKREFWNKHKYQLNLNIDSIDIKQTISKFGYSNLNVNAISSRRIIVKCQFCFIDYETSLISFHKSKYACCIKCAAIANGYSKQNKIKDKHIFYSQYNANICKLKEIYPFIIHPRSDKRIEIQCDFCHNLINKQIKYINYDKNHTVCYRCSSIAHQYSGQHEIRDKHEFWKIKFLEIDLSKVDIQGTIDKFGYNPQDNPIRNKKLCIYCCFCHKTHQTYCAYFIKKKFRVACADCKHLKNAETNRLKYGVSNVMGAQAIQDKLRNPSTERIIESILTNKYKMNFIRNFEVPINHEKSYSFDFYLPTINLLIECQGDYFHNFKKNGYSGTPKDRAKSSFVEMHTNYKLVHIWEHEIHLGRINKILNYHIYNATEEPIEIKSVNDLQFKRIPDVEAHTFLSSYHYLGNLGTASTCYGCFYNNNLISVCTFGGTTRQSTYKKVNSSVNSNFGPKQLKELRRFCIRPNVKYARLASTLIRSFTMLYKSEHQDVCAVISFADQTVGDVGTIYKYSGWKPLANTEKSYHYLDPVSFKMIHKKTVWNCANQAHMKENDFVERMNLTKVEELPKYMWIKNFV